MTVVLEPVENGLRIPMQKPIVFIGRHPDCDVVLRRSRKVSRKHCCIVQVNNEVVVRDLGSLNGLRINGRRVRKQARLGVGDELSVGDVRYILTSEGDGASGAQRSPSNGRRQQRRPETPAKQAGPAKKDGEVSSGSPLSQDVPLPIPGPPAARQKTPDWGAAANTFPLVDDGSDEDDVIPLEDDEEPIA